MDLAFKLWRRHMLRAIP